MEILKTLLNTMLEYWYFWVIAGLLFFIKAYIQISYFLRLKKAGIYEIDKMSGEDFELFLVGLFRDQGYQVELVGKQADYGADLVIERDGRRCVIQAKRWRGKVPIKAVQEVIGAKGYYQAQDAKVVTNSIFTRNAWNLAKANHVWLIDRERLVKLINETNSAKTSQAKKDSALGH